MIKSSTFKRIWLPGFLFQSVLIGGGYATGRELIEFFLIRGPLSGLLGIFFAALCFSLVLAISFELARRTKSYDYRSFFKQLLGRGWVLFEITYFAMVLLILAVLGAASGELARNYLEIAPAAGTIGLMMLIGVLVFWGTSFIEKVLTSWSFVLYATYIVFIAAYLAKFGGTLNTAISTDELDDQWLLNSVLYFGYNLGAIPMIIFCVRHMETRRDAFIAGALAGPIGMIPALLFFLGMSASYPGVVDAALPSDYMMQKLDIGGLEIIFYIVVFGTFVETGSAVIHSINERISNTFIERQRKMPRWLRPAVAITALSFAIVLAERLGLINLIAKGYGSLTYVMIAILAIPLLTVGVWKISQREDASVTRSEKK